MADFRPTASQQAAIDARGGAVLVSAGAGSGKTRVLTERLMGYICDDAHPVDLDSFLIITFTRAAAAELRGRIMEELAARLAADPGSRRLRLDLGRVGETARVYVNGKLVGDRVTAPYSYDITDYVREGENELVVIVSNTLANRVKDHFSTYMQIPPSGLLGPVKLLTAE